MTNFKPLPNFILEDTIYAIDEGALCAPGYDLSHLKMHGLNLFDMRHIEALVTYLRKEPHLTREELIARQIDSKIIDRRLGGMNNIRTLLDITY